jgi:hypothetical protein
MMAALDVVFGCYNAAAAAIKMILLSEAARIEEVFVVAPPINIEHKTKLEFVAWIVVYTVYVIVEWRMT